jgi:hypothetical protein
MSFELSPNRVRSHRASNGSGLSILATLISPIIAVCLSEYLHTHEKRQTTFALPVPSIDASPSPAEVRHSEPRPELSTPEESPRDRVQAWQALALQPEKQALAKKLIASADVAKNDPASRFLILRRAKDVATEANDGQTAFQAIDAMAETFHADGDTLKMSVLTKLASAAREPAQHKSIAEQALKLGNQAVGPQRLTVASRSSRLALAEAMRSLDNGLVAKAQERIAEVGEQTRARGFPSGPSGGWRQEVDARLVQKLQPEAEQDGRTNHRDDLLAARSKRP